MVSMTLFRGAFLPLTLRILIHLISNFNSCPDKNSLRPDNLLPFVVSVVTPRQSVEVATPELKIKNVQGL